MRSVFRPALAAGIVLLCGLSGAGAQGDVSMDVQQACTPDVMRLCSEFVPDVAKITACMKSKGRQVSVECRTAMAHSQPAPVRHVRRRCHYHNGHCR